ncbi:MAG: ATP-binding cassette domain-containing protein [Archaeoglobus sp.]|nr:ATP-binding cassette domain-containing protein [Archaeoglobus sp.]
MTLKLLNGSFVRKGRKIIDDVSLEIRKGEVTLLFGPNGSGKSTVFHSVIGILKLTSGEVLIEEENITSLPVYERFRRGIVLAPEKMRVAPNLTVEENLLIGCSSGAKLSEVYELFPVLKKLRRQKASTISGGERQMTVFGRALLSDPKYLLLDEPFQGLQKEAGDRILETIERLKEENVGVAVISHERVNELIEIADRFYIMIAGKVAYEEEIESVEETLEKLGEFMLV